MGSDRTAKAVPLIEQLRSVPPDAVLRIDTPNALGCMDTRSIPVGRLCREAANVLAAPAEPQQTGRWVPLAPTREMQQAAVTAWMTRRPFSEVYDAILAAAPQPVVAPKPVAANWPPETAAQMIACLQTFPGDMLVSGAYWVDFGDGRREVRLRPPTISRERADGIRIRESDQSVPYSLVIWTSQDERATPPASPSLAPIVGVPLTDAQITRYWKQAERDSGWNEGMFGDIYEPHIWFARAIEAAHSIGGTASTSEPAVRMLTDTEIAELEPWPSNGETMMARIAKLPLFAGSVQRKFIEVNGLNAGLPAGSESGSAGGAV